jgi:probable rRNA maturation factor
MDIIFNDERMPGQAVVDKMKEASLLCLSIAGVDQKNAEISVSFVSAEEICALNMHYRGVDKVTDVLSFPQFESALEFPKDRKIILGDVIICTEQALLQADEFGHSPERELVYLLTHGVLHLLGYDHAVDEEKEAMRAAEEKIMNAINLER